jgi:flavodoxin
LATDSHPLHHWSPIGQAIVIYNGGLSGGSKDVSTKIGYYLQDEGYNVLLAGVNNPAASSLNGYDIIVVGGPNYAGKPSSSIQTYLNNLNIQTGVKVGVFGYGSVEIDNTNQGMVSQNVANLPVDSSLTLTAVIKITSNDNIDSKCEVFVEQLLQ